MKLDAFDFDTTDPLHEHLALDFANTTPYHHDLDSDNLNSYADLLSWSLNVDLINEAEAERLMALATRQPDEAVHALQQAIYLREAIFKILADIAQHQTPQTEDLSSFHVALAEAMAHMQLVPQDDGFVWGWVHSDERLDAMLWPVAWSTAQLLKSDDHKQVKQCEADDCDWLFLDTSRNHSRRWCDMKTCGNRAKARRYYQRSKEAD